MTLKIAERGQVPPFIVMDVMRAAAEREATGKPVLHLEVGQPSTPAPSRVRAAAKAAIDNEVLGYTLATGIPDLRARIAAHYRETYGVDVGADRVVVTTGSSGGFQLAFCASFAPGDRVALAAPGYPAYRNILTALGCIPVEIPVGPETRYQPTEAHLDALDPAPAGLIVASPANPTGTMLDGAQLADLARACRNRGIRLVSDEIYHGISYGTEPATLADDPHAITINSFSKYYSMTGWRLGWLIAPPDLARSIECLAQNMFISAPSVSQAAAVAAFDCADELNLNVARYAENRRVLLDGLPKVGLTQLAPADGAFYIYADIGHLTDDSAGFCSRLLNETGIAATPGLDFDPARGHRTMRFSFAGATDDMHAAVAGLSDWLGRHQPEPTAR